MTLLDETCLNCYQEQTEPESNYRRQLDGTQSSFSTFSSEVKQLRPYLKD